MLIHAIIKDSSYSGLSQFRIEQIKSLEQSIRIKRDKSGHDICYVNCLIRNKEIRLSPEEIIRQLFLRTLIDDYQYPPSRIALEYPIHFGRETRRTDIVVMDKTVPTSVYIIVEVKKPKLKDGKEQLKSYCHATGAPIAVWTNGESISYYHRKDPNYFADLPNIPKANEKLTDILTKRYSIEDLIEEDKLATENKTLKGLIEELENEVLANAGVDVFEELFKLIFTKLYDEFESGRDYSRYLEFRDYGETEGELKEKIQKLFDKAKNRWKGIFTEDAKIQLTSSHLSICMSSLQDVKLFNSNLEVIDDAFEYLIQYFTPRYIIDMCVKMLNPQENESVIDTAAGSSGFPVHTIFHVWYKIMEELGMPRSHLFTLDKKPARCEDYVRKHVFAIDFDEKAVRVARTLNLISGDGESNLLHLNTLDYERWNEKTADTDWINIYNDGWKRLSKHKCQKDSNKEFNFDILMANPPFAGEIKESRIISKYELRSYFFDHGFTCRESYSGEGDCLYIRGNP